ncbi:unnamed protein product [Caenorhabditis sp. 36 PRJEB53466]|nr:unnamed protein product [Caenorhabditis sp. 36 PRJEB53466]
MREYGCGNSGLPDLSRTATPSPRSYPTDQTVPHHRCSPSTSRQSMTWFVRTRRVDYGGMVEMPSVNANETAMHMAARSGNQAVLLAMVNKIGAGAVQIVQNKQSKNGWSPLLEACARGHTGVANILLKVS